MDLELHKNIENDLVKRSSLAQNLIKQLNNRIKELETKDKDIANYASVRESKITQRKSDQQSRVSDASFYENKK